jgi:hemerythrin
MRKIQWTDAQAVHVPEVDEEHQALFRLCDDLRRAVARQAAPRELQSILDQLITHTAGHFAHEEREMRAAGYAHYAWHRRQHRTALAQVARLDRRIRRGDRGAASELLEFLGGWLNDHIGIADRMLGAFLRNRRRAQPG